MRNEKFEMGFKFHSTILNPYEFQLKNSANYFSFVEVFRFQINLGPKKLKPDILKEHF